jgi:membrane-bound lytic murein transglycosylase MltF
MGPSYLNVQEQVVCGYGKTPRNIKELMNYKIEIITMSSYVESMNLLKSEYPELKWKEHEGYTTEHIFDRIDKRRWTAR